MAHLQALADVAKASVAAIFEPGAGDVPLLRVALSGLDQAALDAVTDAWSNRRQELLRMRPVRYGTAMVLPMRAAGDLVALAYLDSTAPGFPSQEDLDHSELIAKRVRQQNAVAAPGPRLARDVPINEEMRRTIDACLRRTGGVVSAAADEMGIHRDTLYYWASKLGLDLDTYRPKRRRRR